MNINPVARSQQGIRTGDQIEANSGVKKLLHPLQRREEGGNGKQIEKIFVVGQASSIDYGLYHSKEISSNKNSNSQRQSNNLSVLIPACRIKYTMLVRAPRPSARTGPAPPPYTPLDHAKSAFGYPSRTDRDRPFCLWLVHPWSRRRLT